MRRARGFTLMEILIAMALTTIVTAAVLAIVRTQLTSFEMQDQIVRTQQNTRAAMDFVETMVRRACGGINNGAVYVFTPTLSQVTPLPCLRHWDGAAITATSFSASDPKLPDALEVVYASGSMSAATDVSSLATASPSVKVGDVCSFSAGDYVIITDTSYGSPALFYVNTITPTATCPSSTQIPGTLSFGTVTTAMTAAIASKYSAQSTTAGTNGSPVFKAYTYSIFVAPSTAGGYANMLMVDPNGVVSSNHLDYGGKVQPAVEGVVDFQVAVGRDTSGTGTGINLDWTGDAWGESLDDPNVKPWNLSPLTTPPQYRQVRLSLLLQTSNYYPGTPSAIIPFEDRPLASYPTFIAGQNSQRYRSMRIIVAPRAWNLAE
jgi:prepilin-type N-terminal cleavage/methylation domain-containing protein